LLHTAVSHFKFESFLWNADKTNVTDLREYFFIRVNQLNQRSIKVEN